MPASYKLQAPAPSHSPLRLQLIAPSSSQSLCASVPSLAKSQVPSGPEALLASVQAWQTPLHAVSQHTLSTQKPLPHSWLPEQAAPSSNFALHSLPAQYEPPTQPLSSPQPEAQVEPRHR